LPFQHRQPRSESRVRRKSSHPRQKRRSAFASEASFHGLYHPGEHVPLLPPTGFHHRQQPLDKPAPR
jgi:hypothetical protein